MKIVEMGTTYKVYGEDLIVLENLPVATYKIGFGQFTGFFLEKQNDLEVKEEKIYGVHEKKVEKVLHRFEKFQKNMGVILSGDKGIGKSLFARMLAKKSLENGIPIILVDNYIPGIVDFINSIQNEILVLFDEFDKTFAKTKEEEPQAKMLSLFDGTSFGKKLFVITCNDYNKLNEYLINRPGRFHFHFRFDYPNADEVKEYLHDKIDSKYYTEIPKVAVFSRKIKLNYDCLSAIAMELNEGESFENAIQDLNIISEENGTRYDVKLLTHEGNIFTTNDINLNLFSNETTCFWINDQENNSVRISFKGTDPIFDQNRNVFILPMEKVSLDFDEDYMDASELKRYKSLHYTHVEISLNYGNRIHYQLTV